MKNDKSCLDGYSVKAALNCSEEKDGDGLEKISDISSDKKKVKKVEEVEIIIDTTDLFGKCRVASDCINTYKQKELIDKNINMVLSKDETFYFDKLHNTNKGNVYVSWGDFDNERIYAPYRIVTDNNSSVIRISE